MRDDWDARAKANPLYFIDTHRDQWGLAEFFEKGRQDAHMLTREAFRVLGSNPTGERILEIGCGIGRLFPGFADMFDEVWGADVSPEMIELGRKLCPVPNAKFVLGNGQDLGGIPDSYFDYCFSYLVFIHVPRKEILWSYLSEIHRVLKPEGAFQLHFRKATVRTRMTHLLASKLPRGGYGVIQAMYRLMTLRWARAHASKQQFCGSCTTWEGVPVSPREVLARLSNVGFVQSWTMPDPTHPSSHPRFWVVGRKS